MKLQNALVWLLIGFASHSSAIIACSVDRDSKNDFIIVLDAGHGGKDHGAAGKLYKEKDLTLQMTLLLGQMIEDTYPHVMVKYTRAKDHFIPLYKRIDQANKINADLFISIHCNYVGNKLINGTETYVMGMHRAEENLELAKRENDVILMESDYQANYDGFDPDSPIAHIFMSTVQNAYLRQSLDIAAAIEKNFNSIASRKSRGVKQAGFAVLRRATMPSILIETGFLSNQEEELSMASDNGQLKICKSIVLGLNHFLESKDSKLEEPTSDDQQVINQTTESNIIHLKPSPVQKDERQTKKYYTIQIAALRNKMDDNAKNKLEKIGKLHEVHSNGLFKYRLGEYANLDLANKDQLALKTVGYHATIIIENIK